MGMTYYVDAVSQMNCSGDVVKISFVNVAQKNGTYEIVNQFDIAMTIAAFMKLKDTSEDLFKKLTDKNVSLVEASPAPKTFSKVSTKTKKKLAKKEEGTKQ